MEKRPKTPRPPVTDLHPAVLDFIERGRGAQAAVDAIIDAENERLGTKRPKGRA